MTQQRDRENDRHQSDGENNEVIANLQNSPLEVANCVRLLHQLCGLAEVCARTGG